MDMSFDNDNYCIRVILTPKSTTFILLPTQKSTAYMCMHDFQTQKQQQQQPFQILSKEFWYHHDRHLKATFVLIRN